MFAKDPVPEEIVRLGREYRESLRPGKKNKTMRKVPKTKAALALANDATLLTRNLKEFRKVPELRPRTGRCSENHLHF